MKDVLKWVVLGGIFVLPFLPLLVTESLFFPFITGKNFAFRIIVEVIFAAWVLLALYEPMYRPKRSWILYALGAFVVIIGIADVFGASPEKSFWSNFERMEGWVTLVHLLLYVLVAGCVLSTEKLWTYFFNTTLAAASIVSFHAFAQLAGTVQINQGGSRIDATLGNAAYMAVYMLFHTFIAFLMLVRARVTWQQVLFGFLGIMFAYLLVQTATRGTLLGLLAGLFVTTVYLAFFERTHVRVRKVAIGALISLVILVGGFYVVKDTAYVQQHPVFNRIASISLEAGETRFTIWRMALKGVAERPVLGWGQGNFGLVFAKHYDPSLYAQEPWFDRVHNIVLDWLIAGGIVGFLSYCMLLAAIARPLFWVREDERDAFTTAERSVLLGLLVGYVVHNFFVFDNIISYLFFGSMLAFVYARTTRTRPPLTSIHISPQTVVRFATPTIVIVLAASLYVVNVPNILAARDVLDGIRYVETAENGQGLSATQRNALFLQGLHSFEGALSRTMFAAEEVRQRLAVAGQTVLYSDVAQPHVKEAFQNTIERELAAQVVERPDDAQVRVFVGTYYRVMGDLDRALAEFEAARERSPRKQRILFDIGLVHIEQDRYDEAFAVLGEAFEYAPSFDRARELYMVAAIYAERPDVVAQLSKPPHDTLYRESDYVLQAYYARGEYDRALALVDARITDEPDDPSHYAMRARMLFASGNSAAARATIAEAIEQFPQYAADLRTFLSSLEE